ncbi:MAG: 30S ribosomal protein S21 [Bacteriovoracaceae bacterium]|nr:30S ribosomal protein S21 [Bacteriovoracaceae bacterium]
MASQSSIVVNVDERLGVERSLKKFRRLCESFGVIREYRKRQEYKKPSIRLKEKVASAEKRRKKNSVKFSRPGKL